MRRRAVALALAGATAVAGALAVGAASGATAGATASGAIDVTFVDDGVRAPADPSLAIDGAFPDEGPLDLGVAAREETLVVQALVTSAAARAGIRAEYQGDLEATTYAERFVDVAKPSSSAREPGASLAFTKPAAPDRARVLGVVADALVPGAPVDVAPGRRSAIWVDLFVPRGARAGAHEGTLRLVDGEGRALVERRVVAEVIDATLPWPGADAIAFYDRKTLVARMGEAAAPAAERSLRRVLHAHRVAALDEVTSSDESALALDRAALHGDLYTAAEGYEGPGEGVGDRAIAIGAYGALGEPDAAKAVLAGEVAARAREARSDVDAFVYAVDEQCKSPRPLAWKRALADAHVTVAVAATCGDDPSSQAADVVMTTADRFRPDAVARARASGKRVWVYNGRRPFAGPMMLDVPPTDLRANAWIAARYGVERWFYWETTFWRDDNRGGKGGAFGFDPYVVAETFHNADGDAADGDGVLVYPGTQRPPGMVDLGRAEVFPSVRLEELRRGAEDAGWIALARARDAKTTDAIVRRVVPRALAEADEDAPPSWPDDPETWRTARRALADVVLGRPVVLPAAAPESARARPRLAALAAFVATVAACGLVAFVVRRLARRRASAAPRMRSA